MDKNVQSKCISHLFHLWIETPNQGRHKCTQDLEAVLFGVVVIILITPLVSFGLVYLPFQTRELSFGLAIFFHWPNTTISSGVILTGQARGNIALGLMLTVVTNLLAIISMPLVLSLVFYGVEGVTVSIDAGSLL